jgi:hypothetical protein
VGDECARNRNGRTGNKISAPGSKKAPGKTTPGSKEAQTDPRFHYGEWFKRQQQQRGIARQGRPLPRPTVQTPALPQEPQGRAAKRITIPKKAWGDATVAPMSLQATVSEEDRMAADYAGPGDRMRAARAAAEQKNHPLAPERPTAAYMDGPIRPTVSPRMAR